MTKKSVRVHKTAIRVQFHDCWRAPRTHDSLWPWKTLWATKFLQKDNFTTHFFVVNFSDFCFLWCENWTKMHSCKHDFEHTNVFPCHEMRVLILWDTSNRYFLRKRAFCIIFAEPQFFRKNDVFATFEWCTHQNESQQTKKNALMYPEMDFINKKSDFFPFPNPVVR